MAAVLAFSIKRNTLYGFEFNLELIYTSEFFKKLQVQIGSKLNKKNRMITY